MPSVITRERPNYLRCISAGAAGVFRFPFTMVDMRPSKNTGGGYGDVRARIDEDKLNAYLSTNVPAVATPVIVKQFKVRPLTPHWLMISHSVVSLARSEPYYVLYELI